MENVLVDMPWQGKMRKLLVHPGRTGFVFVMDRETGELLSAEKFEPVTWASATTSEPARYSRMNRSGPTSANMAGISVPLLPEQRSLRLHHFRREPGTSTFPRITPAWITRARQ